MVMLTAAPFRPNQAGQHRDEDVGVDREEEHLEDGVEGDQSGAVLGVALGQVVPDDDHGDAARQADQDEPDHVLRLVAQEEHGEAEHQERADDPVLDERQPEHPEVAEDGPHLLVPHLGERRVHHEDQPDGDRDGGGTHARPVEQRDDAGEDVAHPHADRHRREDPDREVAIQEGEAPCGTRGTHVSHGASLRGLVAHRSSSTSGQVRLGGVGRPSPCPSTKRRVHTYNRIHECNQALAMRPRVIVAPSRYPEYVCGWPSPSSATTCER